MAAFDPADDLSADVAFRMLSISAVTLFFRPEPLANTTEWLHSNGYQLVQLDSTSWSKESMLQDLADAFSFPSYYGRNLDALNDCLRDVVDQEYGWTPESTGLVVVFSNFEGLVKTDRAAAHAVLDIFACHSRAAALIGRRLLCLVQTNDPDLALDPVGATPMWWNHKEWLASARH